MTNSRRFISAYNKIDNTLRQVYGFKANMTFTDVVRRSVVLNAIVRRYEDDLVSYARLRNAIVHNSEDGQVIAEPHDDVVAAMEKIARLIATPPLAYDALVKTPVHTADWNASLVEVIRRIRNTDHSNMPVFGKGKMLGVVNNKVLVEAVGEALNRGDSVDEYLRETRVGEILRPDMCDVYYTIVPRSATLEHVLTRFERNRKLLAIIITPQGTNLEEPVGIITPTDILDINNILDSY